MTSYNDASLGSDYADERYGYPPKAKVDIGWGRHESGEFRDKNVYTDSDGQDCMWRPDERYAINTAEYMNRLEDPEFAFWLVSKDPDSDGWLIVREERTWTQFANEHNFGDR